MGISSTPITAWIIWSLLLTGAALVVASLIRDIGSFRQWKRIRAEHDGEIVLAKNVLKAGQCAHIALQAKEPTPDAPEKPMEVQVLAVSTKTLVFALERDAISFGGTDSRRPQPGETAAITMTGEGALYRFTANIDALYTDPADSRRKLLEIACPIWLARIQRRQHVRTPMSMPVLFEGAEAPDVGPANSPARAHHSRTDVSWPLRGTTLNLSGGGLCAEVGSALSPNEAAALIRTFTPGAVLNVRMPLPALSEELLPVQVRTSERTVTRGGLGVRLACEFLQIAPWERDLLIHHVFRAQRTHRQTQVGAAS